MVTSPGTPISCALRRHSPSYAYDSGVSISTFLVCALYLNTGAGDAAANAIFSSSVNVPISVSSISISGSNLYTAVATGCHLAWSRPTPLRATQRRCTSWFLRSFTIKMPPSAPPDPPPSPPLPSLGTV